MKKGIDWKVVWAIFIGLIMIMSTVGFLVGQGGTPLSSSAIKVNGHTIEPVVGGYLVEIGDAQIGFSYSPFVANRTKIPPEAINQIKGAGFVFMTSNFSSPQSSSIATMQFQISELMGNELEVQSALAFTSNYSKVPVISCANASPLVPVIEFQDANQTGASYSNNCLVLHAGSPEGFLELRDRLVYGLFGILT